MIEPQRLETAKPHVHWGMCENSPVLSFERDEGDTAQHFTFACFDAGDIHGVTDIVAIQPSTGPHDYVLLEKPCCANGYALTPEQTLALISALQRAYKEMAK